MGAKRKFRSEICKAVVKYSFVIVRFRKQFRGCYFFVQWLAETWRASFSSNQSDLPTLIFPALSAGCIDFLWLAGLIVCIYCDWTAITLIYLPHYRDTTMLWIILRSVSTALRFYSFLNWKSNFFFVPDGNIFSLVLKIHGVPRIALFSYLSYFSIFTLTINRYWHSVIKELSCEYMYILWTVVLKAVTKKRNGMQLWFLSSLFKNADSLTKNMKPVFMWPS